MSLGKESWETASHDVVSRRPREAHCSVAECFRYDWHHRLTVCERVYPIPEGAVTLALSPAIREVGNR